MYFFVALAYAVASFLTHPGRRPSVTYVSRAANCLCVHVKKADHSYEKETFVFLTVDIKSQKGRLFLQRGCPKVGVGLRVGFAIPTPPCAFSLAFSCCFGKRKKERMSLERKKDRKRHSMNAHAQDSRSPTVHNKKKGRRRKKETTAPLGVAPEQARDLGDHARNKGKDTPNVFLLIHYNDRI